MYHNSIGFLRSLSQKKIASQGGRIDQAFWIAWGNMAAGKGLEDAIKIAIQNSGLEPASKEILVGRIKKALSKGSPKFEDLPIAYQPAKKTAMVSDLWGEATKKAKRYWQACLDENHPIRKKDLIKWLMEQGYENELSESVADTVNQFYASISQYNPGTDIDASKNSNSISKKASSGEHSYSCTMAIFPKDLAEKTIKIAMDISDASLYDPKDDGQKYGREVEPHITVKYGTHTDDPEEIKEALKDIGFIRAKLGRISLFDTNEDYDVVKIDVVSSDLEKANKLISDKCKNTDSYPKYIPHATIAYVEKGTCEHLIGNKDLDGVEVVFEELAFHDTIGNVTVIKLKNIGSKEEREASVLHPLDEKGKKEWFGIKIDAGNYHQQVRGELTSIIEDIWKVSEKNFKMIDTVKKVADRVCRLEKASEIIEESKEDEDRPRFCAEKIYCILKSEIRK